MSGEPKEVPAQRPKESNATEEVATVDAAETVADVGIPEAKAKEPLLRRLKASEIVSVVALLVSIYAAREASRTSADTVRVQAIKGAYDTFYDINRMELSNTEVSHMFALPENYKLVSSLVSQSSASSKPQERAQLVLKERAVAIALFTIFERNFYEFKQAEAAGDGARADFLREVLGYFCGRLLRNPRLVHYWSATPGGLAEHFEPATRKYYEDASELAKLRADREGPFGGQAEK